MKKNIVFILLIAAVVAAFLLSGPQSVQAGVYVPPKDTRPAAGSWSWDNENVTGTIIPQYQLAPTNDDDYALLQSEGVHLSGGTRLCHPYPGGQIGWNAEIRVLTNTGWQPVPTVNEWVPDEEGKYMTCAQANYSGTYAVFGYWVRPEGWMQCPVAGFGTYMGPVDHMFPPILFDGSVEYVLMGCGSNGTINYQPPITDPDVLAFFDFIRSFFYCCNDSIYLADDGLVD